MPHCRFITVGKDNRLVGRVRVPGRSLPPPPKGFVFDRAELDAVKDSSRFVLSDRYGASACNREVANDVAPPLQPTLFAVRPTIFILHLFAGRRRGRDVQEAIEAQFVTCRSDVVVLSVDIVNGSKVGLTRAADVDYWMQRVWSGQVAGVIAGPPCETWSTVRYVPGDPPPLRYLEQPFGLPSMTCAQIEQVGNANALLLVELLFCSEVTLVGAAALLEHPARHAATFRP